MYEMKFSVCLKMKRGKIIQKKEVVFFCCQCKRSICYFVLVILIAVNAMIEKKGCDKERRWIDFVK